MKGILIFAVKDDNGRLLEIINKTSEDILDEAIDWENENPICEFEKVMVKSKGKIDFYAKIKTKYDL